MGKRRSWLPKSIHLQIEIDGDDPQVAHVGAVIDGADNAIEIGTIYPNAELDAALPGDVDWRADFGVACQHAGETDTATGPMAAVGTLLDNALDPGRYGAYEESEEDEDEDEDDEDEEEVRSWALVAENTWALEVRHAESGKIVGCVVRYEDDGNWPSVMFVPGVSIVDMEYRR